MKSVIDWLKKVSKKPLFLPLVSVFLVLIINVVYDAIQGNYIFEFLKFELKEGALYGRIIDILNRGSEAAILAIGMTLVVSSSAGTDISVGSVMSLCASFCCMLLAGSGVSSSYLCKVVSFRCEFQPRTFRHFDHRTVNAAFAV